MATNKRTTVTFAQREVLQKMLAGWQLKRSTLTAEPWTRLQPPANASASARIVTVSAATTHALERRGLITWTYRVPTGHYTLTQAGVREAKR
jgi:hypothetical protein